MYDYEFEYLRPGRDGQLKALDIASMRLNVHHDDLRLLVDLFFIAIC